MLICLTHRYTFFLHPIPLEFHINLHFFHLPFKKKHSLDTAQNSFHSQDYKVGSRQDKTLCIKVKCSVTVKMAQMCTSRSKRKKYDGKGRIVGLMSMKNSSQGAPVHQCICCRFAYIYTDSFRDIYAGEHLQMRCQQATAR